MLAYVVYLRSSTFFIYEAHVHLYGHILSLIYAPEDPDPKQSQAL